MKNLYEKLTKDSYFLKALVGITFILFAVIAAYSNFGLVSSFINWCFYFIFGPLSFLIYLLMVVFGLKLLFLKKELKIKYGLFIFGIIFIAIGVGILVTHFSTINNGAYLTFDTFSENFSKQLFADPKVHFFDVNFTFGGIVCYLIVALLNQFVSDVLTIILGTTFIIVGAITIVGRVVFLLLKRNENKKFDFGKDPEDKQKDMVKAKDITLDTQAIRANVRPNNVPENKASIEKTQAVLTHDSSGGIKTTYVDVHDAPIGKGMSKARFNPNGYENNNVAPANNQNSGYSSDYTVHNFGEKTQKVDVIDPQEEKSEQELINETQAIKAMFDVKEETVKEAQKKPDEVSLDGKNTKVISNGEFVAKKYTNYEYPPLDLLTDRANNSKDPENIAVCEARMQVINETFQDFKVGAKVIHYTIGPSVTRFDVLMDRGQSTKTVNAIVDDISTRLNGTSTRFVPIVPGKNTSGLEIPNIKSSTVNFKECYKHLLDENKNSFNICFGKNISGEYIDADLREFPHVLIAGTTGSGKSVFLHSLIMPLIMRNKPNELRFVMIDPKQVEFNKYRELPHLLCPVVNDPIESGLVLNQLVDLMDERYSLFRDTDNDNIGQYNKFAKEQNKPVLPYIVIVIDEYTDLFEMNKQVGTSVSRLAQKARAAGIHIVIATQRPSVNIMDGVIKANLNTRVALMCSSSQDSTIIIGSGGAEKLLGYGDMLIKTPLVSKTDNVRAQGSFLGNDEIRNVVKFLKERYPVDYIDRFCDLVEKTRVQNDEMKAMSYEKAASDEEQYKQIRDYVMTLDRCSISLICRNFGVGYPKGGKIFNRLIEDGVVDSVDDAPGSNKGRRVILKSIVPEERHGSVEQTTFDPDKEEF